MRRDKTPQRRTHHTAAAATTTWDLSSPSSAFLEQVTVDGGEWETALGTYDEPWEDQSWEEAEEAEVLDNDWTDELPPEDPELEDQFGSLEAAEAYAVTEFKNASSDMRNATRTFMEAKDLSSKVCKRLLSCGRCGCFRWFSNDNAERIMTDWRCERYEHWHEQPGRKRTWSWTRRRLTPSRFPTPIASQIQSDINRSCEGRTGAWNSHPTRSVLALSPNGRSGPDCPNRGTRDDSGINLKRAFGCFVEMTGDKYVSSLVPTATPQQEVEQGSDFTMSHVPVAVWLSLDPFGAISFLLVSSASAVKGKTQLLCATFTLQRSNVHHGQC